MHSRAENSDDHVLIAHPGRQHSHQLAGALDAAGLLWGYWTGVPARPVGPRVLSARFLERVSKYDFLDLPREKVSHCFVSPVVRKLAGRTLSPRAAAGVAHRADGLFDRWSATRLARTSQPLPGLVVCYENSALHTFRVARRAGIMTVLDAASVHHADQARWLRRRTTARTATRIAARKDAEIDAADHILTASEFARESYLRAGVPPERVTTMPLGVDLERFDGVRGPEGGGPVRFLFVGSAAETKGADLLHAAVSRLEAAGAELRLAVAGGTPDDLFRFTRLPVEHHGRLSQRGLADLLGHVDCLVLPSRFDSFAMVVIEALASGVPVIVSDRVGAKQAVVEGRNGWVVPAADVDALANALGWCVAHPERLRNMGAAARRSAMAFSWDAYAARVVRVIADLLADGRRRAAAMHGASPRGPEPRPVREDPCAPKVAPP